MPAVSKVLALRYPKACSSCGERLPARTQVWWDARTKTATCGTCINGTNEYHPPQPVADSIPGASASKKLEWLSSHGKRDQLTLDWKRGVEGEQLVGEILQRIERSDVKTLHDRRIPGTFKNIDHIVVAPRGVYVVDSKNWTGRIVLAPKRDSGCDDLHLYVNGRDRSARITTKISPQVECVQMVLEDFAPLAQTRVEPVICFVRNDWSRLNHEPRFDGVELTSPETLVHHVTQPGPLDATHVDMVWTALAIRLKPAV